MNVLIKGGRDFFCQFLLPVPFPLSRKEGPSRGWNPAAKPGRRKKGIARGVAGAAFTMASNLLTYHLLGKKHFKPLYVVWHPTLRCNLSCSFCDDYTGKKYPELSRPELSTPEALRLLELLRAACRAIYFTGGEPFVRKDFPILLRRSRQLGFRPICVNTNLTLRAPLEAAVRDIDVLVVSLGSTDCAGYDRVIQGAPGQTARILENLEQCVRWQANQGPLIVVNCVISADRLGDARSVYNLCQQWGIWFSPAPEIKGVYMDSRLLADPQYLQMVDEWLAAKKEGAMIYGSVRGLEILLKGRSFRCCPPLAPQIYVNGDLLYPCKPLRKTTFNILELGSFAKAWQKSLKEFSPIPTCDNRCHMACFINNSQWMEHPLEMIRENLDTLRQSNRGRCV